MNWTAGLQIATIALVLLVPFGFNKKRPGLAACVATGLYATCYFTRQLWQLAYVYLENPQAYGLAMRLFPLSLLILIAILVATIYQGLKRGKPIDFDLQARLIWLVFLTAEVWGVLQYMQCKMFVDPFGAKDYLLSHIWGVEVSRFACGRRFGLVGPFVAPIITALTFLWIKWRASGVKR